MSRDRDAHLLSGGYALHALTAEESALVEAAMAESEELRGEVVGMVDTAVALGLAVPAEVPPVALRGRLLDAIADLPQERAEDAAAGRGAHDEGDEPVARTSTAHVVPHRRRRRRRLPVLIGSGVLAAALLFGGGIGVWNAVLQPQTAYAGIEAAADVHHVTAAVEGGGTARISWSASRDRTAVVLSRVHVPSGHALQLWSVRGRTVTSEGLYGGAPAVLSGTPAAGERLAVSVEPAGGSKQPTTTPIAKVLLRT